jgi:hypothetical protein
MSFHITTPIEILGQEITFVHFWALCVGLGLAFLSVMTLMRRTPYDRRKTAKLKKFSGTWKSRIHDSVSGSFEIRMFMPVDEDDVFLSHLDLTYDQDSTFKAGEKVELDFDCDYDPGDKVYTLRQRQSQNRQVFMTQFHKETNRHPKGELVCVGPGDFCDLTFDKTERTPKDR